MPAFPTADAADLERLRQFDTPTICNVVELFDLPAADRRLHGRPHPGVLSEAAADGRLRLHGHVPAGGAAAIGRRLRGPGRAGRADRRVAGPGRRRLSGPRRPGASPRRSAR